MFNQGDSAFAPSQYLFQANAAAIGVRFRRPNDFSHTEGSACLMASGGRAGSERKERVILNEGAVTADGYFTEVTGDFVDREAAARLTESQRDTVSDWRHNTLEVATTTECTVNGLESINHASSTKPSGQKMRIGQIDFKMEGRHRRKYHEDLELRFGRLTFSEVSINGARLKVSVLPDVFDSLPTFSSFQKEYNRSEAFRKEIGHMVYRTEPGVLSWLKGHELHDRRGYCLVTVVNKIEWADPKEADPRITINGHTVLVPGYGTIYFGEMTIAPTQRRLHMVRAELGCRDGASLDFGLGCAGGHELP